VVSGDDDPSPVPTEVGAEHGTSCAGLVAASTNNGEGIAGACPECRMRCVRLLSDDPVPLGADVEAFDFAFQTDAAVVSNSWGFVDPIPVPAMLEDAINNVFDNMLVYEPNTANLVPALVTRIPTVANGDVSADGLNYTYHLKPNLSFSDGTELNATVMKRAIDLVIRLDLAGSAAFLLYDVGGLTADGRGGNDTAPGVTY